MVDHSQAQPARRRGRPSRSTTDGHYSCGANLACLADDDITTRENVCRLIRETLLCEGGVQVGDVDGGTAGWDNGWGDTSMWCESGWGGGGPVTSHVEEGERGGN